MKSKIQIGDRWAILGATGSGKTVLSRALLSFYYRATKGMVPIWILDTKVQGDFKIFEHRDLSVIVKGNDPDRAFQSHKKRPFVIWQPEEDNPKMYDEFFKQVYLSARAKYHPGIIYIDELSSITENEGGPAPRYFNILLKQGRGMNNGIINVTQSPSFLPRGGQVLRQATHIIRMHLNDDYDIQKLKKTMGSKVEEEPNDDYGFWYRNCTKTLKKSPPVYYSDFKDFIGLT